MRQPPPPRARASGPTRVGTARRKIRKKNPKIIIYII